MQKKSAQTKGVPVFNSISNENLTFLIKNSSRDKVNETQMTWVTILEGNGYEQMLEPHLY